MKKIIYILFAATAAMSAGCTDFLDTVPDNRTKIDNIDKVKALLVSAYPVLTYPMITDARCDGYADFGMTLEGGQPSAMMDGIYSAFRWEEYTRSESGNDTHEKYWMGCYEAIAAANHALAAIEELGDKKEYAPYKAEAKLCRAYAHFMLLSLYSNAFEMGKEALNPGIPYVTEPETTVIKAYSRGTVASTLEKIKKDIEEGLAGAGGTGSFSQPKFHFTRSAALALAVRFSLYTGDYQAVINYANQLLPNVADHVTLSGANSDGSAIEVPSASDAAALYARANLFDWLSATNAYSSPFAAGQAFTSPKNNNVLLSSEVVTMISHAQMGTYYSRFALGSAFSSSMIKSNATGLIWGMITFTASGDKTSFIPKYYGDPRIFNVSTGAGVMYAKLGLFRLEEVLLARAEAYAMTGEYAKALDDLNIFTQKRLLNYTIETAALYRDKIVAYYSSEITNSQSFLNSLYNAGRFTAAASTAEGKFQRALVMTCLDFRRVEFIYEGLRWFDILRWNIPVTHTMYDGATSTLTPNDDRRVLQIPQTASLSGVQDNRMSNIPYPWQ